MEIKTEDVEQFFHGMPDEEIRENWINIRVPCSCFHCRKRLDRDCKKIEGKLTDWLLSHYCGLYQDCEFAKLWKGTAYKTMSQLSGKDDDLKHKNK